MASKVHRVRFYKPKPQAISCVSFNKKLKLIALARADASIEIWDLKAAPYLVRFIPGVQDGSVEALGWVGSRLLSTGLGGALVEWDLINLCQKKTVLLTGYAAWCLDVSHSDTMVAVGTEQGYINLYSVEDNDIVYKRLFDKQDGRIMCCMFDNTGNILVTGSIDTIRVWNVETGHATSRMSVTRRQKEVIVWSVAILSDKTIVSGDSHGRLTFWDSSLGEQIESFSTHKADILSIAVSEDEQNLYCSGMDPTITHFVRVSKDPKSGNRQWVKNVQRHIHEHDVRALVINERQLISAGMDGYLTFSSYPPKWVMRVPPLTPAPRSSVCSGKKLLLLRYNNHLEVWKLGSYATDASGGLEITKQIEEIDKNPDPKDIEPDSSITAMNGFTHSCEKQRLKLTENPVLLVSIKAKNKKQIQCCELSPSGEFIVYSTNSDVRMLKLDADDSEEDQTNISLSKIYITGLSGPCSRVAFTEDSRTMIACCGNTLNVLYIDPEAGATVLYSVDVMKDQQSPSSILHLLVSKQCKSGTTYVVVADSRSAISVLSNNKKKFALYADLPKYQYLPTALSVDEERETLIVVYTNQTILEYDLLNKKFTGWPGKSTPAQWLGRTAAVQTVCTHPTKDAIVLQDETSLWVLERKAQDKNGESRSKRNIDDAEKIGFSVIPIKYLAGFHWLSSDEAVAVEVPPENIVSQLPAPVQLSNWHARP